MPKFLFTYAADVSCYVDFVIESPSKTAALRLANTAKKAGRFDQVNMKPDWSNGTHRERILAHGERLPDSAATSVTLDELSPPAGGDSQ